MSIRFTVLGAGSWGTTLAIRLAGSGHAVRLWGHDPERTRTLAERRENVTYLPGFRIPTAVEIHARIEDALAGAETVLLAVPSHLVRDVLGAARHAYPLSAPLVIAAKGIEGGTLRLMSEVATETIALGPDRIAILSGPSFALEVAKGLPTAVVVASSSASLADELQSRISDETLRLYTNEDPVGVQVAGALKNVMAIAAGVLVGLDLGTNAAASLLTRGLAEMARLGGALGGRPATFAGLAGLGDLVLTANGELSRNRRFGVELGRGRRPQEILAGTTMVVEGVRTAQAAEQLAAREGVTMPIVEQVYRVLYDGVSPHEAVAELMRRPLRREEGA